MLAIHLVAEKLIAFKFGPCPHFAELSREEGAFLPDLALQMKKAPQSAFPDSIGAAAWSGSCFD